MSIQYTPTLNRLTNPPSYAPSVRPRTTVSTGQLAATIGSATSLNPVDVQGVLQALAAQILAELLDGNWVQLDGIGIITSSLTGRLASPNDPLPPGSKADIGFRSDATLRKTFQAQATYERLDPPDQSPLILTLAIETGQPANAIPEGAVFRLSGDRLTIHEPQPDEGAFFTPATGSPIRVTNYLQNGEKALLFIVPTGLTSGTTYTIVISNRRPSSSIVRSTTIPGTYTAA